MSLVINLYVKFVQFLSAFPQTDIPLPLLFFPFFPFEMGVQQTYRLTLVPKQAKCPHVPELTQTSLLLGHDEGGLPFQRVKAFLNTDLYLGLRKQHVGMNKKKKRSCLVSVCDICLGEESAELIGNPIVETLTSQL